MKLRLVIGLHDSATPLAHKAVLKQSPTIGPLGVGHPVTKYRT
jgi:hypothetical protein